MNTNKPGGDFAQAKASPVVTARRVVFAVLILAGLIFVIAQIASGGSELATQENGGQDVIAGQYRTIVVPSYRMGISYTTRSACNIFGFRYRQRIYSVCYMPYLSLEASSSQHHELLELRRREGGGMPRLRPQLVDGEIVMARSELRYFMVELRYIPNAGRHPSNFAAAAESRGHLIDFTPIFEDNTITAPVEEIEVRQVPVTFRQLGVHPYTYELSHGTDQSLEISRYQYAQLRELLDSTSRDVMIELHYRVHSQRLLDFTVLED